jgi:hypothetical protein
MLISDTMANLRYNLAQEAVKSTPKDEQTGLPKKYVAGLNPAEKAAQKKAISKSQKIYKETGKVVARPAGPTKRSSHSIKFENRYGFSVSDLKKVKQMFPNTDVEKILSKGRAAYASGSRPGVSPEAWAKARLASVLTGGKALAVDKDLVGDSDLRKIRG